MGLRPMMAGSVASSGTIAAMEDIQRFLEMVCRDLGAEDARLQIGGAVPDTAVTVSLPGGFEVVALFAEVPVDRSLPQARLEALVETFSQTLDEVRAPALRVPHSPRAALDEALEVLVGQAGAIAAWVMDDHSPEVWGSSLDPRGQANVDDALSMVELRRLLEGEDLSSLLAGADASHIAPALKKRVEDQRHGDSFGEGEWRRRLRVFDAAADSREVFSEGSVRTRHVRHDESGPYLARTFGGLYRLLLVFGSPDFSELHAEAAMIHALPWIEKLTGALPPVDPGGGRVLKMRRLRPV